jgi:hypothetical protein
MSFFAETCRLVSILSFLGYGCAGVFSGILIAEFERYGLPRLRKLVSGLEVLGALGLIMSYSVPVLGVYASGGLCLLMFFGVLTRIRIGDSIRLMLPALTLLLMNAVVFMQLWGPSVVSSLAQ